MLDFLRHALALTATVQGQLALLVRLQWIAGRRVADVMTAAPFAAVLVLTRRIRWFMPPAKLATDGTSLKQTHTQPTASGVSSVLISAFSVAETI
jgi:hypothetical protein